MLLVLKSVFFKKKVHLVAPDVFRDETSKAKKYDNQILVVFNNGYWEIKEEVVTKEWSADTGSQTFVDFDTDIDDDRYQSFMNDALERDQEGEHPLKIVKELELKNDFDADEYLKLKY